MGFLDWLFGSKKPKYPRITNDMFQPPDSTITTAEAKRLYRDVTMKLGYHQDKTEAAWGVKEFEQAIEQKKEQLEYDIEIAKCDLESFEPDREVIKELRADLRKCKDAAERADIEAEIEETEAPIKREEAALQEAIEALKKFKSNKRAFLIAYLNHELHGDNHLEQTADA